MLASQKSLHNLHKKPSFLQKWSLSQGKNWCNFQQGKFVGYTFSSFGLIMLWRLLELRRNAGFHEKFTVRGSRVVSRASLMRSQGTTVMYSTTRNRFTSHQQINRKECREETSRKSPGWPTKDSGTGTVEEVQLWNFFVEVSKKQSKTF